jgi:hypothetical protein
MPVFGAALAMVILILSPAIPARMISYNDPTSITALPGLILQTGFAFYINFFRGLFIPASIVLLSSASLVMLFISTEKVLGWKSFLKSALIITGIILLICASVAPSAYIEHGLPEARGQLPARVILLSALWATGGLTGAFVRPWIGSRSSTLLAFAAIAVCFVYTARSIAIVSERLPIYMERAEIWDERNAQISRQEQESLRSCTRIDSLPVGGMKDLKANQTIGQ